MATNLRAYRDGNRLVLVIENPTKDLESLVGSLLSGEVKPVADLVEPKAMAKPKLDVSEMQEIPPTHKAVTSEPKKAPFVKKLEEEQQKAAAMAQANAAAKPTNNTQITLQTSALTARRQPLAAKTESATSTTAAKPQTNATATSRPMQPTHTPVSNVAKPTVPQSSAVPQTRSTVVTTSANARQQMPVTVAKPQQTSADSHRAGLIKQVWAKRSNAKIRESLRAKFGDANYDIRRLNTAQLEYLNRL